MAEMSTYRLTLTEQSTSTEDYDVDLGSSTITAKTCKGLLYALNLTNNNYTIKLHPTTSTTIGGEEIYGFFFQEDNDLKTGLNGAIEFNGSNTVEPDSEIGYTPDQIIIQGLQITGSSFLKISSRPNSMNNPNFQKVYFKDCVYTVEEEDNATYGCFYNFWNADSNYYYAKIKDCKFSIHIRQGDLSNLIINNGYWDSCSFYIEYSDLTENSYPAEQKFFNPSQMNLCSILIRRATLDCSGTNGIYLISQCNNTAFDIQFHNIKTLGTHGSQGYFGAINYNYIQNCFISIKFESKTGNDYPTLYFNNTTGVNIINKGNPTSETPNDPHFPYITESGTVKALTETECKSQETLGNYGFFVNTVNNS